MGSKQAASATTRGTPASASMVTLQQLEQPGEGQYLLSKRTHKLNIKSYIFSSLIVFHISIIFKVPQNLIKGGFLPIIVSFDWEYTAVGNALYIICLSMQVFIFSYLSDLSSSTIPGAPALCVSVQSVRWWMRWMRQWQSFSPPGFYRSPPSVCHVSYKVSEDLSPPLHQHILLSPFLCAWSVLAWCC